MAEYYDEHTHERKKEINSNTIGHEENIPPCASAQVPFNLQSKNDFDNALNESYKYPVIIKFKINWCPDCTKFDCDYEKCSRDLYQSALLV